MFHRQNGVAQWFDVLARQGVRRAIVELGNDLIKRRETTYVADLRFELATITQENRNRLRVALHVKHALHQRIDLWIAYTLRADLIETDLATRQRRRDQKCAAEADGVGIACVAAEQRETMQVSFDAFDCFRVQHG